MEQSILTSTKKSLGLAEGNTAFDFDIAMWINAALSDLNQLDIGPAEGLAIEDDTITWDDMALPVNQLGMAKTFVFLKVKLAFDPPGMSFLVSAMQEQIKEYTYRLLVFRDEEKAAAT